MEEPGGHLGTAAPVLVSCPPLLALLLPFRVKNKPECSTKGQWAQRPPVCCWLSRLGSGAAPAAGAHRPPARQLPKVPPPLLSLSCATLGMPRMGLSWDVNSGVAVLMVQALWALGWHILCGDRGFGSGCDSLECCLLCNGCWVVLLPPLMNFWALRAGMRNCVFRMGFGERVSLLGGCGASSCPSSRQHFSLEVSQNAHNPNLNIV